jgi:hypothetical protein
MLVGLILVRRLHLAAANVVLLALVSGCSSRSELASAYYKCVSTFGENVAPTKEGLGLGPTEDYLALDGDVLTVTTPAGLEPGVGAVGATEAVLCVMDELDAPDARRHAPRGRSRKQRRLRNMGRLHRHWKRSDPPRPELQDTQG